MAILTLSNLKKAFGNRDLFEDVSFFVNERERVALIGANGTGKTTLLRIICGEESCDSGNVNLQPGSTVGYLPQDVDLPEVAGLHLAVMGVTPELLACASELAVLEKQLHETTGDRAHAVASRYAELSHQFDTLNGFEYEAQAKAILIGLGFDESEFNKPIRALSGGQKTRAALARLLLLSPDILLLDEPTNHLDIKTCEWLQDFLQNRYQGSALIISHDRYFLDHVVSKVVELENGTVSTYIGNYSAFGHQKAAKIEEQRKLYKSQQKEIARLEETIQTLFSHRKFTRRDSKVKQLERLEKVSRTGEKKSIKANLNAAVRSGREVLRLSKLSKSYPGKNLFTDANYVVERGRKIGIVGPNGSGKTTLLKIIAERELPDSGEVIFGHNVKPVYFAQEFDHLDPNRTVIAELLNDTDMNAGQARDLLAKFLFLGDDAFKLVEVLSGGEKCRLALAKVLASNPNLLLLDEPTNHLDIASREALEDALRSYNGTVVTASHDRYLLDAVATEIVEIKDGAFTNYLGNYSNYKEKSQMQLTEITSRLATSAINAKTDTPVRRPMSSTREKERSLRDLSKLQKELEHTVHQIEERMAELTSALADEENYRNGSAKELSAEYDSLSAQLEAKYSLWEQTLEQISEIEEELKG